MAPPYGLDIQLIISLSYSLDKVKAVLIKPRCSPTKSALTVFIGRFSFSGKPPAGAVLFLCRSCVGSGFIVAGCRVEHVEGLREIF